MPYLTQTNCLMADFYCAACAYGHITISMTELSASTTPLPITFPPTTPTASATEGQMAPAAPKTVSIDLRASHGPPVTLSVAFIVKNEELELERILRQAAQVADELIVVDTGSTDRTKEIALNCGAQVFDFKWIDDFSAARNEAFSHCTKDWILWLDADDVLPPATIKAINFHKAHCMTLMDLKTIFCPYHYEYENGKVAVNLNRERIVRNHSGHKWQGRIHEVLSDPWNFSLRVEDVIVEHRTHKDYIARKKTRNLEIFEQYIDIEKDSLRELFLYGSELHQNKRHDDAEKVLKKYISRADEQKIMDLCGERYSVLIKLADIYYSTKRLIDCMEMCHAAIKLNPDRAEACTILGVVYLTSGWPHIALPWFIYSTLCQIPPATTSLIVQKLYWESPMALIKNCFELGLPEEAAKRLSSVSALVNSMALQVKKAKKKEKK